MDAGIYSLNRDMSEARRTRRMQNAEDQPVVVTDLEELFDHIRTLFTKHDDYMRRNEYRTRICLIDPVLRMLGWDVESPELVELELELTRPEGKRADYALKVKGRYVAIVEAKSFGSNLESKSTLQQAYRYARGTDVQHFVLTDGNRWKLYSLNKDVSVKRLQPDIEFDVNSDKSSDLVRKALSLRQPELVLGRRWSRASKPIFKTSASDSKGVQAPIKSSKSPPKGSIWHPISKLSVDNQERPPAWIKFPDKAVMSFVRPGWIGVPFNVARWLVDTGQLCNRNLPVKLNGKGLVSATSFSSKPREVRPGFWMKRQQRSDAHLCNAVGLLQRFGIDSATVFVNFGDTPS